MAQKQTGEETGGSDCRPTSSSSRSPRKVASQFFSFRRKSSGLGWSHDKKGNKNNKKKKKEVKFPEDPVARGEQVDAIYVCSIRTYATLACFIGIWNKFASWNTTAYCSIRTYVTVACFIGKSKYYCFPEIQQLTA